MKTKSKSVSESIKNLRYLIKATVRDYLLSKMIAWSIEHLILPGFKIEVSENVKIIPYNKLFSPKADQWDKQVAILTKRFDQEPSKDITKDRMQARFFISHSRYNDSRMNTWSASSLVYIDSVNTESCEIEMVKEVVETPKLTGYCAALVAKKYLKAV